MRMNLNNCNRCQRASNGNRCNLPPVRRTRWTMPAASRRRHSGQPVPPNTDFSALQGTRLLAVMDDDNLRLSSRNRELRFSYRKTLERLNTISNVVLPLAVVVAEEGDTRRQAYLRDRGWRVLAIPRETVLTHQGPLVKANADFDLVFELGHLLSAGQFDTILLGTGDGDLAVSVGRGVRRTCPGLRLFTLSVAGSASKRLRSRPDLFDGHFLAGLDLSRDWHHPTGRTNQQPAKGRASHV
jgi:hypothetical protein